LPFFNARHPTFSKLVASLDPDNPDMEFGKDDYDRVMSEYEDKYLSSHSTSKSRGSTEKVRRLRAEAGKYWLSRAEKR
jgi:hypothetical protein